jgi:hypothetical protein
MCMCVYVYSIYMYIIHINTHTHTHLQPVVGNTGWQESEIAAASCRSVGDAHTDALETATPSALETATPSEQTQSQAEVSDDGRRRQWWCPECACACVRLGFSM